MIEEGTSVAIQDLEEFRDEQVELDGGFEREDALHDLAWMMKAIELFQELSAEVAGDTINGVLLRNRVLGLGALLLAWAETIDRRKEDGNVVL